LVFNNTGKSHSWRESNINVLRLFELFGEYSDEMQELLPVRWFDLPEETLTEVYLYDCFLKFLWVNYIIEKGAKKGQRLKLPQPAPPHGQAALGERSAESHRQSDFLFLLFGPFGQSAKCLQKTKRTVDHTTVSREIRKGAR